MSKYVFVSDQDKDRDQRDRLQRERLANQVSRDREKHEMSMERIRYTQNSKAREKEELTLLNKETQVTLKLLDHSLKPETLDMEFKDLIRRSDIELQTLEAELQIRDRIAQSEHNREVDRIYQKTMMEVTQETARILDERNKAIAINEQETKSILAVNEQEHNQTLEQREQAHLHELIRDKLQAELQRKNFSHEEKVRLITRLVAKELGLNEGEISTEQVEEWVEDFVRNEQ